jgi:hypothetical protein
LIKTWREQIVAIERDGKKAYASPSLKKWGSIRDLTLGFKGTPGDGGGAGSAPHEMEGGG